jgi:SAM-dependent methyltransferase
MDFDGFLDGLQRGGQTAYICGGLEGELWYMRKDAWRFRRLLGLLPGEPGPLRLLDIGPTPFTLFLKEAFPRWDVWALDRTDHLKDRFERAGVTLRSCDLDGGKIPLDDGAFDFVLCAETLEHVFAPPTQVLREIARLLRPGGRMLLSVPNLATLRNRLRLLLGRSPLPNPDRQMATDLVHGHGHVREYTRKELVAVCRAAGFEILRVRMVWKSPADILRLMAGDRAELVRHGFYVWKLLHAGLNTLTPSFRGDIVVECRKPPAGAFSVADAGEGKSA